MMGFSIRSVVAVAVSGVLACCASVESADAASPLKVAVFVDKGITGIGAVEWYRLVQDSPEMELHLIDGERVRQGVLDGMDILVVPGGNGTFLYNSFGPDGIERMKNFLRAGGGYIGTCAGCCLLMDGPRIRARMMPWNSVSSEKATMFPTIDINEKGAAALGLEKGPHVMRYHLGPFMWPTTNVIEGANFELWGTMDAEATMKGRLDPGKRMYGSAAIVGGTFGKGRVFVTTVHPEYFNGTLYILRGAFRYVAQREVTFPDRPRTPRAVAVGFLATGIYGIETAETALAIDAARDMDLTPIDINGTAHRYLDHIDVLVVASDGLAKSETLRTAIAAFMRRGGKVVGFGRGADALPEGGVACAPRKGVVETIRKLFPGRTRPMLSCGRKGTDIGGVFPLLCTPYNEDGSLDCGTLAKEAAFVADCGAQGVIWPAAKEALTLLTPDEERRGLEAIAAALQGRDVWFAPCCPGTNTVDVLRRAAVAGSLAAKFPGLKTTMLVRMADDANGDADYERQYEALATATKLPVIVQTYNGKSPMPSSKLLIDLARRHPGIYGWFKVEGTGGGIVPCMRDLVAAKPVVKTVFTGWGGRDWLYHYRRVGTRGVISQRPMYADLMETIWRTLEAGDPAADEFFAKFMYLRNLDDVLPAANMRGWNLYVLKKRGVFRNLLSREAKKEGGWELRDLTLDAVQKAEIDARLAYALGTSAE